MDWPRPLPPEAGKNGIATNKIVNTMYPYTFFGNANTTNKQIIKEKVRIILISIYSSFSVAITIAMQY
jgi:hypothetical protein